MDAPHLVVGIGASAGGLEPLLRLVESLPPRTGMAIVVVHHMDPSRPSAMSGILGAHAQLPVVEVAEGMPILADRVHVIPPNAILHLEGGAFHLSPRTEASHLQGPIDVFFSSLAADRRAACAAVVLSGMGADGAVGIRAIKAAGGAVFVQSDAEHRGMPEAAIATGLVDHALPAGDLGAALVALASESAAELPPVAPAPGSDASSLLGVIQALVHSRTGHDFTGYKTSTLLRRIHHRMLALNLIAPDRYLERLRTDPDEAHQLLADLLIGVTRFFRDPDAFAALEARVFTPLVEARANSAAEIRVWVPGCSTGEEAYSLAILLQEQLERVSPRPGTVTIFATDIDTAALDVARRGHYPSAIAEQVSRERLERFFVREANGWRVGRAIRDMCIFSAHSLVRDPPFARLDLVSCRNVLIYLSAEVQHRILRLFNYVLNPNGHLFLGPSESVDREEYFSVVDKQHRIFRRVDAATNPVLDRAGGAFAQLVPLPIAPPARTPSAAAIARSAERLILENYAPPCVVVDRTGQVVCTSGRTSRYLELPAGAPSLSLAELVRGGLRFDLREAMDRCRRSGDPVVLEDVPVVSDGTERRIDLVVRPFGEREDGTVLIVFRELTALPHAPGASPDARIERLEAELATARNRLQAAIDELAITREDFQQTNEELLSLNEELQSANEELQTSKEEMQSVNEEVETVNAELRNKVEELDSANSDLHNLFRTQLATLFLDRELRIKRFTPACQRLFRLVDTDVGRPIGHILPLFAYDGLSADIREVLDSLAPVEREVPSADGQSWFGMRILPYRTTDDVIAGVVLTFVDLTSTRQLQRRSGLLAAIVESSLDAIYSTGTDGIITSWNAGAARLFGWRPDEVIGREEALVFPPGASTPSAATSPVPPTQNDPVQLTRQRKDGSYVEVLVNTSPILDPAGNRIGTSTIAHDVTQRRLLELELEQARKMEGLGLLAGGIAHDFNNLLTAIIGHASLAERKLVQNEPVRAHLKQIVATSQRSSTLTRQLLAFAEREVVPARVIDANALLAGFTPLVTGLLPASIETVVRQGSEPAMVRIDPSRLEQVLMNLAVNAREAMPEGGALTVSLTTVQVGRTTTTRPGPYVRICVADTGKGMTAEQRAHCFDPFYTTKGAGRSNGLGLATAYGIVHNAGGFIEVESSPGRGSTFAVHLPREASVEPGLPSETPEAGPIRGGKETILLVEDSAPVRETSVGNLELQGYKVLAAVDGVDAVAMAAAHPGTIHLLVTDIVMPRMGGRQLAVALRARRPELKVLYVSGYAPDDTSAAVSGSEFLPKPFTPAILARKVRELLDR